VTIFAALDFETSDYSTDSACAIGIVRVENGVIVREYCKLMRPPRERMRFTDIHGIRWSDVADQPTFGELWPEIVSHFEGVDFIVAHNASFDKGVLHGCCEHYEIAVPNLPFRCTVQVARKIFGIFPAKLNNVCRVLGIDLNHHEALSDARACAQILLKSFEHQEELLPKASF
jgi:DNA polymerase-3 subunit epsilon